MDFEEKLKLFYNNKVVNWHEHAWLNKERELNKESIAQRMEHAELTGQDIVVVSCPITRGHVPPEEIEHVNNVVAQAMDIYKEKIRGMAYIDPVHGKYAVLEIERCIKKLGMIGVKLYCQYKLDDKIQNPIIEKCIELDVPILMHAGGKSNIIPNLQPNISDSVSFISAAKKYPEAKFIMAHIGGGGDWNWQLKGIAEYPNIFVDISGSVFDDLIIEETVREIGAQRMLFGTDGSFSSSIGKLSGADLTKEEMLTIMNNPSFAGYLERGWH